MKQWILFILILTLTGCSTSSVPASATRVVEKYVKTLDDRDVEGQLSILEGAEIDGDTYYETFLQYVEKAEVVSISKAHENDFLITMELQMSMIMDDEFSGNGRLHAGENLLTRYFTFRKEDMKLFEIFDKLIIEDELEESPESPETTEE